MTNNSPQALTVRAWLDNARRALQNALTAEHLSEAASAQNGVIPLAAALPSEQPALRNEAAVEASSLLGHVLGKSRAWLLANPQAEISSIQHIQLDELLARRCAGEPLPYLIGHWEFYGLDWIVTPAVLIPRPETELLVERAAGFLTQRPGSRAVDVGTGSGCIAVTLAKTVTGARVYAVDRSLPALRVARQNALYHGVTGAVSFWQGDLLLAARGPFDLVCANLPYIPSRALVGLPVARHEPGSALDGGEDGLGCISALLADAPRWLAPGGMLLLEIQYDQSARVTALARSFFPGAAVRVLLDLAGLPRIVEIHLPAED